MWKKMEARYYWTSMRKDVAELVKYCHTCQACKGHKRIRPPVQEVPVQDDRFKDLQVDIVGPLPVSEGMRYLLTVLCRNTRWIEAFPLAEANTVSCSEALIRGWIQRFGLPRLIKSDNGNTFISEMWEAVHKDQGVDIAFTPPYHPSSLGGVERQHKDIKLGLQAALFDMGKEHGSQWMSKLPWVMLGKRTAFQPALDTSAAEMVLGTTPLIPGDIITQPGTPLQGAQLKELLETVRMKAARPPVQTSHNRTPPIHYPDLSDVTHAYVRRGKTTPLSHKFDGPFQIVERMGSSCVKLRVGSTAKGEPRFETQHWENLKPAHMRPEQEVAQRPTRGRKPLNPEAETFKPTEETKPFAQEEKVKPPPPFTRKKTVFPRIQEEESAQPVQERRTRTRIIKAPVRYQAYSAVVKGAPPA